MIHSLSVCRNHVQTPD